MKQKHILAVAVCLILICTCTLGSAAGKASGVCGPGLTFELDDQGTLTISGSGKMNDYTNTSSNDVPWQNDRSR